MRFMGDFQHSISTRLLVFACFFFAGETFLIICFTKMFAAVFSRWCFRL